jgi:hypothetical protein
MEVPYGKATAGRVSRRYVAASPSLPADRPTTGNAEVESDSEG